MDHEENPRIGSLTTISWQVITKKQKRKVVSMEDEPKSIQPIIGEYQGKPIIRIPTVENPNPDTTWHWLSFGKNKAKAIVKFYDAIKKFAEE